MTTTDEIIFAVGEVLGQLEDYRAQLETRHRGKLLPAYGDKVFRVADVRVVTYGPDTWLAYWGPVLRQDGEPNKSISGYSTRVDDAKFLD